MIHCLKSLTKVKIHHIYSFSTLHKASYPVREVNEFGLMWSALDKSKLSVSFQLVMLERIKNWLLIICSSIFPGVNAMLPCLQIPRFLFPTFKSCSLICLSSGLWELTILDEFLKIITNGLDIALASSLSTPGWVSSGPANLNSSDLFNTLLHPCSCLCFSPLAQTNCAKHCEHFLQRQKHRRYWTLQPSLCLSLAVPSFFQSSLLSWSRAFSYCL